MAQIKVAATSDELNRAARSTGRRLLVLIPTSSDLATHNSCNGQPESMPENVEVRLKNIYQPSHASLALRAHIARVVSPLRPVTPKVPFWLLAAHRIPTLWSLYRGLLREARSPDVKWKIGQQFRKYRHLTSPRYTKRELQKGHRWLDIFRQAREGDERWKAVVGRYTSMLAVRREKDRLANVIREELAEQNESRKGTILTGAFLRPTFYNKPLPRLKPQPVHISGMIHKRRVLREKRQARYEGLLEAYLDVKGEADFEKRLIRERLKIQPAFSQNESAWFKPIKEAQNIIGETFNRERERAATPFPQALIDRAKQARREKIANKTRERERERRGEVLPCTIARANKGPPAHILAQMSPLRRHWDRVSRSNVSEVGYVGLAKRKLGWKLKNPDAWKVEIGKDEDQPRLDALEEEVRQENLKRRL